MTEPNVQLAHTMFQLTQKSLASAQGSGSFQGTKSVVHVNVFSYSNGRLNSYMK